MRDTMKKKGSAYANILLTIIVILGITAVVGIPMGWYEQEQTTPTGHAPPSKVGDLTSFKLTVEDDGDNPTRYAGTGYCYDVSKPTTLISGGSVSLSASASTTVSPVTIGQTIECVAFDSSHQGVPERMTLKTEGEEMILSSKNITGTAGDWSFNIYEDGAKETTKSLIVPAGTSDKFDKFILGSEATDTGFNLKEICLGSNSTSSEISSITLNGLTAQTRIPYSLRNSADFCFKYDSANFIRDFNELIVDTIKITTTASFTAPENVTGYFLDEAHFEKVAGGIGFDVQDDTVTPATTGATDITGGEFSFLVVPA